MKRSLLIAYLVVCIALIGAILIDGLDSQGPDRQPDFYRTTAQSVQSIHQAQTEAAEQINAEGTPTPGRGGGGGHAHPSATPTVDLARQQTLTAIPTIED